MTGDPWEDWWDRPSVPMRPLALRPGEEPRRPDDPAVVPFDICLPFEYDSGLAPFAGAIVPIEHVRAGDRQVVVQGRVGAGIRDEPALLNDLARFDSIESIIADRPVRLTRPLPGITELMVTTLVPAPEESTLRHLPNLRRLCLGRAPGETKIDLSTLAAMRDLEDLRFDAGHVPAIEPIAGLTGLRRLRIEGQTFQSIAPLAAATGLRWLAIGWWKGMDRLGTLGELEHVELNEGTVSSLRGFRSWRKLRTLTVFGRKLRSLAGIEHFEGLEDLFLYNTAVADLEPLAATAGLRRLRLDMPTKVTDFAPIGRLERLESLIVNFKGSRSASVPRLADLGGLRDLRDLALTKADGGGWRFLLDLPDLRRILLYGSVDADAPDLIRRRFPSSRVDVRPVTPKAPSIDVERLPDGRYSVNADVSGLLGVGDNFEAEAYLRARLAEIDPELLERLDFDSEADALSVTGPLEADLLRVVELVTRR
jgi:hypothetical protein